MKTYRVIQTEDAAKAIHDRVHYIIDRYSNDQAATAVWEDYKNTRDSLATTAGSIAEPESRVMTVVPGTSGCCTGWCRNEWDGSVTMEIQGTEEQIDMVLQAINAGRYIVIDNMESGSSLWMKKSEDSGRNEEYKDS